MRAPRRGGRPPALLGHPAGYPTALLRTPASPLRTPASPPETPPPPHRPIPRCRPPVPPAEPPALPVRTHSRPAADPSGSPSTLSADLQFLARPPQCPRLSPPVACCRAQFPDRSPGSLPGLSQRQAGQLRVGWGDTPPPQPSPAERWWGMRSSLCQGRAPSETLQGFAGALNQGSCPGAAGGCPYPCKVAAGAWRDKRKNNPQ